MAVNLVSMTARSCGISKWSFSPELVAMPEVAGGEDTGDGSQIFGRNSQDDSPRCGLAPQRKSALAVVPLSSGCWSVRVTLRCKHTQRVRKVETETFAALTASGRSPERRRSPARGAPQGTHRANHNGSPNAGRREQDRLEMYGGIGDIWRGYGRLRKIDGVNQQGGGVRREIVWLNSPLTSRRSDG